MNKILLFIDDKQRYKIVGDHECNMCGRKINQVCILHSYKIFRRSPVEHKIFCIYCQSQIKHDIYINSQSKFCKITQTPGKKDIPVFQISFETGGNAKIMNCFDAAKMQSEKTKNRTRYALRHQSIKNAQIGRDITADLEKKDVRSVTDVLSFLKTQQNAIPYYDKKQLENKNNITDEED